MDLVKIMLSIKGRYGKKPHHHGDCNIYRADHKHCSCGFLHDLMVLNNPELVYRRFYEDFIRCDAYVDTERSMNIDIVKKVVPGIETIEYVDVERTCTEDKKEKMAIEEVFGDSWTNVVE